jgi:hypothetical protein
MIDAMFKRLRTMRMVLGLCVIGACGAPSSSGAPPSGPIENAAPAAHTDEAPAVARAVVIKHGPMTYVMDTPRNQLDKARAALDQSGLVAALVADGVAVTFESDPALGDTVIVQAGTDELGRADLHDLDGKDTPAALLDAIHARFPAAP